ncbi:MAG: hypothetical protein ACJAVI_005905 [Candidatus Azotimanducaceae bacterium]|jgi:hypothetical protein
MGGKHLPPNDKHLPNYRQNIDRVITTLPVSILANNTDAAYPLITVGCSSTNSLENNLGTVFALLLSLRS